MTLSLVPPHELTADELGRSLAAEARRVCHLAHQRNRWRRVDRGEVADVPKDQRFSIFAAGWQSRIHYVYSVDVKPVQSVVVIQRADLPPPEPETGRFEVWRHLSIQVSVPQPVTTAEINLHKADLLHLYQPMVEAFFPLSDSIRVQFQATEPIPVKLPGTWELAWRTVITGHFVAPWARTGGEPYIVGEEELAALQTLEE